MSLIIQEPRARRAKPEKENPMAVSDELKQLNTIAEKEGRTLQRVDVLDYARSHKKSAIYKLYADNKLWDDANAAERARLEFAGYILQTYVIVVNEGGEDRRVRGFVHIGQADSNYADAGYQSTESFYTNPQKRETLVREIIKRIMGEMTNYPLEELEPVEKACDKVLAGLGKKKAA
jgi:hypothetical protein